MGSWVYDGSRVYNGTPSTTWQSLDLKAVAGGGATSHPSARTLAMIKIENGAGTTYYGFRPGGTSLDTYIPQSNGHGCALAQANSSYVESVMVLVPTSATGTVDFYASAANACEMWLVGFIECTYVGGEVRADSAIPTSWTSLDITEDTGASPTGLSGEALVYLWCERTGGIRNEIATRPIYSPSRDGFLGSSIQGGAAQGEPYNIGETEGYTVKTDSSGEIEIKTGVPTPNASVDLAMYEQSGFDNYDVEVFAAATPPLTWTTLDISAHIGATRALVLIEVHLEDISPGSSQGTAFRAFGDPGEFLKFSASAPAGISHAGLDADDRAICVAATDASGRLEWISGSTVRETDLRLVGAIPTNVIPTIGEILPVNGTTVTPTTPIKFDVSDERQVDADTIGLELDFPDTSGVDIIVAGVFQSPYTGTIAANGTNGYKVTVDAIPMPTGTYTAYANCDDTSGGSATELSWTWTVASSVVPTLTTTSSGVVFSASDPIRFTVSDPYGVDLSTVIVRAVPSVGPTLTIYTGSAFQTGWAGSVSGSAPTYGTYNTRVAFTIDTWHDDFIATTPKMWSIEVDASNIVGGDIAQVGTSPSVVDDPSRRANLLVDGDMESAGVADWTVGGATISKQTTDPYEGSQYMRSVNTGASDNFRQSVMDVASEYRITGAARSLDGVGRPRIYVGTWEWYGTTSTEWQTFDVTFTASNTNIYFYTRDGGVGDGTEWDNLYLSEE